MYIYYMYMYNYSIIPIHHPKVHTSHHFISFPYGFIKYSHYVYFIYLVANCPS